jgi:hypothetical protein
MFIKRTHTKTDNYIRFFSYLPGKNGKEEEE